MKILVVCQHFYPETFRINDICYTLADNGHQVTVLTGLPNYPKGKVYPEYRWWRNRTQQINNVTIKRCSLIGRGTTTIMMGINYAWFAISASIKALFMKKDFDIVYVYQLSPISMSWPAILVKKMKRIPLIIHCLDQWPISVTTGPIGKTGLLYKVLEKISVWSYCQADRILISSKSFKNYFEDELKIKAEDKGLTYYPSYAEQDYANTKHIENNIFDILFAGNIGPAQSVETIVETANILKQYKDIMFHIVGDGLSRENCEKLKEDYQLNNVVFYGYHDVSKMPEYYSVADCFIITMIDNFVVNSTLPAKVQSYMFAGKPIIGAINGEVKDIIEEAKCGSCTCSNDVNGLANIILDIYQNKEQLDQWGKNAFTYYEKNFNKKRLIQILESIFEEEINIKELSK